MGRSDNQQAQDANPKEQTPQVLGLWLQSDSSLFSQIRKHAVNMPVDVKIPSGFRPTGLTARAPDPDLHDSATRNVQTTRYLSLYLALVAIAVLVLTVSVSLILDEPISNLTRDPMAVARGSPYYGFLSNVGVVFWSFTAAIGLFSYMVLQHGTDRSRTFILFGGLISLVLLGDDLFMLHESVYPHLFSTTEHMVFAAYALLLILYIVRYWTVIRQTAFSLLAFSGVFFAASIGFDLLPDDLLRLHYLFEDGTKFLGIVAWFGYQLSVCTTAVRSTQQVHPF